MTAQSLLWAVGLVAGIGVLILGGEWFLLGAERLGRRLRLSSFALGVSLVAIGTSLPELATSVVSAWQRVPAVALGTVAGSNVTNILLILGVAALTRRGLRVKRQLVAVDLPFLMGSALMLAAVCLDGRVGRLEALLSLGALAVYLAYVTTRSDGPSTLVAAAAEELDAAPRRSPARDGLLFILGGGLLQGGAYLVVHSVLRVEADFGVSREFLASSIVATGTSLPELYVSFVAARRSKAELAIGNVIGSNVFNALGIVGAAALVAPLGVAPTLLDYVIPAMLGATLLGCLGLQKSFMTRWDGLFYLILYVIFLLGLAGLSPGPHG